MLDSKYIYETDLRGFFDNVSLSILKEKLISYGIPKVWVEWMHRLNMSAPRLPEENQRLMDENAAIQKSIERKALDDQYRLGQLNVIRDIINSAIYNANYFKSNRVETQTMTFLKISTALNQYRNLQDPSLGLPPSWVPTHLSMGMSLEEMASVIKMYRTNVEQESFKKDKSFYIPLYWKGRFGVPQGAPTSPFMSMLVMKDFLQQVPSISYADDPIFYSDEPFVIKDDPEKGIIEATEKANWVKHDGEWKKPLKFLGIEYDGQLGTLKASTRKGSTLEVVGDKKEMLEAISKWEQEEQFTDSSVSESLEGSKNRALHSWRAIWGSRLAGFMQACMYKDNWTDKVAQDFELNFGSSSWLGRKFNSHNPIRLSTFTASSYACASLLVTLKNSASRKFRQRHFEKVRFVPSRMRR